MNTQLPVSAMEFDRATLQLLDASRVKSFIGPLLYKMHKAGARKLAVLSWDMEDVARRAAQVLALAMSQQTDRRCALVVSEGIRIACENYDYFSLVTLPEIELPASSDRVEEIMVELNRSFQFQVHAGPALKDLDDPREPKARRAVDADAHLLLVPASGFPRSALRGVERFTSSYKPSWLGTISVEEGGIHV